MESGDLEAFRQFVLSKTLAAAAQTIYLLNGQWLSWNAQVDVARGVIPGDTNFFTFLTAPGLYSTPMFTTYALATTGAEPYPVTVRPLGMPAPTVAPTLAVGVDSTPTTFSVDVTDAGDELSISWSTSPVASGANYASDVTQEAVIGNPTPCYRLNFYNNNNDKPCYLYRNFGVAGAAVVQMEFDFYMTAVGGQYQCRARIANSASGVGLNAQVSFLFGTGGGPQLAICTVNGWNDAGAPLTYANLSALTMATWYRLKLVLVADQDGTATLTASLSLAATPTVIIESVEQTSTLTFGDYCGFNAVAADLGGTQQTYIDNAHVTASGSNGFVATVTPTAYVYTFANTNVGGVGVIWESAPSPASSTVLRPDGVSVTVTTATSHAYSADYGINTKYIYRLVSGATGDVYMLVDSIPIGTADYVDELDDAEISSPGTPLETEDWDLPPADLQGIIPLPNGAMAGFSGNRLCFSVQQHPHAWPVKWRLPIDTDIVAIANIDNTVVIGSKKFVYTATGNDPSSYSMSQPGAAQACVSKIGMTYLDNFGVVFPSPDGFQVCSGSASATRSATEALFSKQQWEALTPSSIRSAVYDGVLYFWCTGPTPDAGYALDTKKTGSGLIRLSHHAAAAHVDPLTDSLYVILDSNSEPTDPALLVASSAVTPTSTAIFKWDAHATAKIVYRWKGALLLPEHPVTLHFAKLEAADYANVVTKVYADGASIDSRANTSRRPYRIDGTAVRDYYEQQITGTSRVRRQQLASTVAELADGAAG